MREKPLKLKKWKHIDSHSQTSPTMPTSINPSQRQIEATDRQIDRLVYELYELMDEEIRIKERTRHG